LFYRDVLQLDVDWGDEKSRYAEFSTGYIKLALLPQDVMHQVISSTEQPPSSPNPDKIALVFAVYNVYEIYDRLKDHHASLVTPP
jgi:lactoylglutathione lyase